MPTATLDRVFALSEYLWKEVVSLPLFSVPPLHRHLIIYELILLDIQHILSSSDPLKISDDTMDRRLDGFLLQFQETLGLLKVSTGHQSSPNSTHFFQNSNHNNIYGGYFIASITNNPLVHDPVVREQSRKILQVLYIYMMIFFLFLFRFIVRELTSGKTFKLF